MKSITVGDVVRLEKKISRLSALLDKNIDTERLFRSGRNRANIAENTFGERSPLTNEGAAALRALLNELDNSDGRRREFRRSAKPSEIRCLIEEAWELFNSWTAASPAEEQAA